MADNNTTASLGIEVKGSGIKETKQDLDQLNQSAKQTAQSAKELGSVQSATSQEFRKTEQATESARRATQQLNNSVGGLNTGLTSLGVASSALRGIFRGLATAVGGAVLFGFERLGDQIRTLKSQLDGLVPGGGAGVFSRLMNVSKQTGENINNLASAFQALAKAQREAQANSNFVFPNTPGGLEAQFGMGGGTSAITQAQQTLSQVLSLSGASTEQFKKMSQALVGVAKAGGLTKQAFDQIEDASSQVGAFIASLFGYNSPTAIEKFRQALASSQVPLDQLIARLARAGPEVQKAFDAAGGGAQNISGAVGRLTASWDEFVSRIANSTLVTSALNAIASGLERINQLMSGGSGSMVSGALAGATGGFIGGAMLGGPVGALIGGTLGAIGGAAVGSFYQSTQQQPSFNPYGFSSGFGPGTNFVSAPSTPLDIVDEASFYGAYAHGGSFTVGGPGGTDSQLIALRATPGETVTVAGKDQPGTVNASLNNSINSTGSKTVTSITGAKMDIVSAINRMSSSVTGALQNTPTSIFIQQGNPNNPVLQTLAGGSGGFRMARSRGGPSFGGGGGYDPYAPIGNNEYIDTSGPGGSYYAQYGVPVAGFDVASPGGGQGDYSLYTDYYDYGSYATGGSFMVGGPGATDRTPIRMMATRGERVTVEPPRMNQSRPRGNWRGPTINVNVYGVTSPAAFIPAAAQIKRAMNRQFR